MTTKEESLSSEALDVVVKLLFELEEERGLDDFYDRLCEAICLQTSMERAVIFLYDAERRMVLPAGSHGVYREFIQHGYGTLEETPIAQRALAEDRVVETTDLENDVPARYSNLPGIVKVTCTPVAAAGRWLGVIFADRDGEPFATTSHERSTMQALGRTAALASHVREVTRQLERSRRLSERIDLAREVHERVTQRLFGVSLALGSDRPLADEDRERCAAEIEGALGDLREALIGSAGSSLMELADGGLRSELDRLGRQYKRLPLVVDWRDGVDVPGRLEPLAVSVLNEALRNAEKHANPSEVRVTIDAPDGAFLMEVRNDGLSPADGPGAEGVSRMGLRLGSYEALQRGGMLEYGREEDQWRVRLVLPEQLNGGHKLSVLVVDDHAVVQWGFRLLLGRQQWMGECEAASTTEEAVAIARRSKPDVALVDLFLGERSGAELCEALREASPKTRVLLISGAGWISPEAAKAAGAAGFISKDWSADEVANAVRMVGRGMTVYARQAEGPAMPLSPREREVLELIGAGATNREIAERLFLSPHTIKDHTTALYRKLGVRNRAEATRKAEQLGLTREAGSRSDS